MDSLHGHSRQAPPLVQLNAFADLVAAWFCVNGREPTEISPADFGRIEQMVGEEVFDLIGDEVEELTGCRGEVPSHA